MHKNVSSTFAFIALPVCMRSPFMLADKNTAFKKGFTLLLHAAAKRKEACQASNVVPLLQSVASCQHLIHACTCCPHSAWVEAVFLYQTIPAANQWAKA